MPVLITPLLTLPRLVELTAERMGAGALLVFFRDMPVASTNSKLGLLVGKMTLGISTST
jgi:hypothetical protein